MVDVVMKRDAQGRARLQDRDFNRAEVVRVVPKNDELRKYLKHSSGRKLNAEGSTEWPNDQFTRRRIKEGDVTVEEKAEAKADEGAQAEPQVIEPSGAKSASKRTDKPATPPETAATVDPDKTTAPKTA